MSEFEFKIVGKDGKVIEDLAFNDFDAVADYMLDAADKWYSGLQYPTDQIVLNRIEDGKVIYTNESSFGGIEVESGSEGELTGDIEETRRIFFENREDREEISEDS